MDRLHGILVFLRVVEHGTLSGAARALGVSTAAVSATLTRLERQLARAAPESHDAARQHHRRGRRVLRPLQADHRGPGRRRARGRTRRDACRAGGFGYGCRSRSGGCGSCRAFRSSCAGIPRSRSKSSAWISCPTPWRKGSTCRCRPANCTIPVSRSGAWRPPAMPCARPPPTSSATDGRRRRRTCEHHTCIAYRRPRNGRIRDWRFRSGEDIRPMPVSSSLTFNRIELLIEAAIAGYGLIQIPECYAQQALARGALALGARGVPGRRLRDLGGLPSAAATGAERESIHGLRGGTLRSAAVVIAAGRAIVPIARCARCQIVDAFPEKPFNALRRRYHLARSSGRPPCCWKPSPTTRSGNRPRNCQARSDPPRQARGDRLVRVAAAGQPRRARRCSSSRRSPTSSTTAARASPPAAAPRCAPRR